ncbi:putative quinol monooxygenase [Chitinasiproducens palmae]|uniref:Quinol monooxygenase YgiN n=1 Tax=Chitinasiproducens palmae TaxID=1770053 RepID=A0A1H2PQY3_9BURK|nr:putative quinol monooxygenase [Chitinasiproducens palmae]SDV48431.1 Quinol monooxygenase YgiN [Chitinasiproducens palmae]
MSEAVAIIVVFTVAPEHDAAFREALDAVVAGSVAEAGCERYEAHRDPTQSGRYLLVERWRDAAAVAQHNQTAHYKTFVGRLPSLAQADVTRWQPLA